MNKRSNKATEALTLAAVKLALVLALIIGGASFIGSAVHSFNTAAGQLNTALTVGSR